jgi:predicted dehydrogenase
MTPEKLKVGIVGAGRMGITHHAIINSHPNVEVAALADPSTVMNSMLEKYIGVRTYKDHASMLEREALDAVLVCTPPALNRAILEHVHRKRLHAFVEKPFALSARDGRELTEMFASAKLVTQVGYVNRFNDAFAAAKRFIDGGLVGPVVRFRSEMYSSTIIRDQDESGWRSSHAQGGGAVFEMASHSIDLINYLFGRPDRVAGTWMSKVYSKNVEDIVSSSLLYRDGRAGQLYVNWSDPSYRKPTNKLEVFGRRGRILADQHGLKIHLSEPSEAHGLKAGWNALSITDVFTPVPFYVRGLEFTSQLYHFVDSIRNGGLQPTRCSFADATATLEIIENLFEDFEHNQRGVR